MEKINYFVKNSANYANNIFVNSSSHLVGNKYPTEHKMKVGSMVMLIGVIFATSVPIHIVADLVGYFIHGLGATPFIEYFTIQQKHKKNVTDRKNTK